MVGGTIKFGMARALAGASGLGSRSRRLGDTSTRQSEGLLTVDGYRCIHENQVIGIVLPWNTSLRILTRQ